MKRVVLLFALLFAVTLGNVMAAQGHPVEPSGAGTETVLSQQDVGQAAITGIAPKAEVLYAVFEYGGEAACPPCNAHLHKNVAGTFGIHDDAAEMSNLTGGYASSVAPLNTGRRLNC